MKSFEGYLKQKFGDSYILLAGGGHKALLDMFTDLSRPSDTNNISITVGGVTKSITLGSNAFNSTSYLPITGGTLTGRLTISHPADRKLYLKATDADGYSLIQFQDKDGNSFGDLGVNGTTILYWRNNKIWHTGNDGTGSGLDADLLDGNQATAFSNSLEFYDNGSTSANSITVPHALLNKDTPTTSWWHVTTNFFLTLSPSNSFQIAGSYNATSPSMYIRQVRSGTPTDWKYVVTEANIGSQSVNYATSAGNSDTVDSEHASAFAHRAAANNLVHNSNEVTMIPDSFSGSLWLNYQSVGRNSSANITEYAFGNGKGGRLASITSGTFNGNCTGSAGSVAWTNVSSKPATATRWPSWSEVTNKPDSFNPSSHTHNYIRHVGKTEDECIPEVSDSFQSFRCTSSTTGFGDGYIMAQRWSYGNFITQLYTEVDPSYALLYRYRDSGGTWGAWKRVPMGDGTGASGTWSINITGNADTVDNKHASDFATSEHNHDSSYIKSGGDDVRGNFTFRGRIFGYNYNNQGSNAAAFMLDKPGNYFTGIGPNGVSNQIHFGPCNTDGTWASGFSQQWEFQGNVYASNYYTTSDARKKQNIHKISDNIKQFEWKETGETSYGFVAQDLEVKHPELVNDDGNMKTVNYNAALSLVVAKLENRVKELEAKLGIDTPPLYLTRTKIVRLPSFSINSDSSKTWERRAA